MNSLIINMFLCVTGAERMGHSPEELAAVGLRTFSSPSASSHMKPGEGFPGDAEKPNQNALVQLGPGLAAIPKKVMERIKAGEYVDFMELPPARGKTKPVGQSSEGQIVVLQATDLMPTRKLVPDLSTWLQCFALYTAAVTQDNPERMAELMAYQTAIAKASQRYKWPSWVIYDSSFRQELAGVEGQSWARVDPSIYSLCFTGQAIGAENWCSVCQTLDHTVQTCPVKPRKRPWSSAFANQQSMGAGVKETCRRFNRGGECRFGRECRYRHSCEACGGPHPVSRCKAPQREGDRI